MLGINTFYAATCPHPLPVAYQVYPFLSNFTAFQSKTLPNPQQYDEQILLAQVAEGDEVAFKVIYEKHWPDLYRDAYRRLQDTQLAEDVVQEVFYRLWAGREHLQIRNLAGYLHQAIRNEVLDRLTRSTAPNYFYDLFGVVLLDSETPEDVLHNKELPRLIARYAATLPLKRREVFLLHIETRLDTGDIAERLQISRKTVQNQLRTAMNGLREQLRLLTIVLVGGVF